LEAKLGIVFAPPTLLVIYHPTTIAQNPTREADELFAALERLQLQTLFCYPNADAGSRSLIRRAQDFVDAQGTGAIFVNLEPPVYWSLLRQVDAMAGNSSSGVMEAASFALPVVDVGIRQRGRERGRNVLTIPAERAKILAGLRKALSPSFRASLRGMQNLYGDGKSSARIAKVLATVKLGEELLIKRQK
jgi:UDP-N-acetylglucosamine 2-epimerase (non-hydrolysing)/GDP/UDP-N,N'-diacetylbacillosamine 2-epimerase (hydrolysing)